MWQLANCNAGDPCGPLSDGAEVAHDPTFGQNIIFFFLINNIIENIIF